MLKKILKGYLISCFIFAAITLIAAVLLRFSSISEDLGFYMLIIAMCAACLVFSIAAGNAVGRKGLLTGIAAALLMIISIISVVTLCFMTQPSAGMARAVYIFPVLAGAVGGIWGTNLSKG